MSSGHAVVLRSIARVAARELRLIGARAEGEGAMSDGADKVRALVDGVRVFDALGAPYALIGGVAVGLHSRVPRATLNTDVAVHTSFRGPMLVGALVTAGFELRGEHTHSVNLRHASGEPFQLAFDAEFDPMIDRAETFRIDGVAIRVVSKTDLIEMKRRSAAAPSRRKSKALRDQADIELLLGDVPDSDEGW